MNIAAWVGFLSFWGVVSLLPDGPGACIFPRQTHMTMTGSERRSVSGLAHFFLFCLLSLNDDILWREWDAAHVVLLLVSIIPGLWLFCCRASSVRCALTAREFGGPR